MESKELLGQVLARLQQPDRPSGLGDLEFRIFSQYGEDGIINYLSGLVSAEERSFVEIGVEDYTEANTRFLLTHRLWRGTIIDASGAHVRTVEDTGLRWKYGVEPLVSFVEPDNLETSLDAADVPDTIGLLSIDIDGMDYWVLESMHRRARIIVVEYNSLFGPHATVSLPYIRSFDRRSHHYSTLYFGASLGAFDFLLRPRGYRLIGCTTAGNNAFFVHEEMVCPLETLTPQQAFVDGIFRQARDVSGRLTYEAASASVGDDLEVLPLVDVATGKALAVRSVLKR